MTTTTITPERQARIDYLKSLGAEFTPEGKAVNDQNANYLMYMDKYKFTDECVSGCDWFKVDTIEGIDYYAPNDEDWGSIRAVDHKAKLLWDTGFYDMDDMQDYTVAGVTYVSDYKIIKINGKLCHVFEAPK